MTHELKMGISGVRGLVHKSIDADVVFRFGYAYGSVYPNTKVIIGRDGRKSGEEFLQALLAGLHAHGVFTIDIGIAPTPTCEFSVRHLKADGAIIISASHNPIEWNGLKFINNHGAFLGETEIEKLFTAYRACTEKYNTTPQLQLHEQYPNACKDHVDFVLQKIDVAAIRARHFTVAVDACHGAGAMIDPSFFNTLNVAVVSMGYMADGAFEHMPEPLPENLKDLTLLVQKSSAQVGFAQDPDADRLAIVDEKGNIIGEECSLVLGAMNVLARPNAPTGDVVVNLSTSRMIEDIAKKYNRNVVRTKIGEMYVVQKMKEINAVFGGEGAGGIIWPETTYCRDSVAGMALTLELMAHTGKNISELVSEIPKYEIVKAKQELKDISELVPLYEKAKKAFPDAQINAEDGLRFAFADSWLHIRPSNTEPIVRIFAEAPTKKAAQDLVDQILN